MCLSPFRSAGLFALGQKRHQIPKVFNRKHLLKPIGHDRLVGSRPLLDMLTFKHEPIASRVDVSLLAIVSALRLPQACVRFAVIRDERPWLIMWRHFPTGLQNRKQNLLATIAATNVREIRPNPSATAIVLMARRTPRPGRRKK
jgi:hypothetical protein